MTAGELIKKLSTIDPNTQVYFVADTCGCIYGPCPVDLVNTGEVADEYGKPAHTAILLEMVES